MEKRILKHVNQCLCAINYAIQSSEKTRNARGGIEMYWNRHNQFRASRRGQETWLSEKSWFVASTMIGITQVEPCFPATTQLIEWQLSV